MGSGTDLHCEASLLHIALSCTPAATRAHCCGWRKSRWPRHSRLQGTSWECTAASNNPHIASWAPQQSSHGEVISGSSSRNDHRFPGRSTGREAHSSGSSSPAPSIVRLINVMISCAANLSEFQERPTRCLPNKSGFASGILILTFLFLVGTLQASGPQIK